MSIRRRPLFDDLAEEDSGTDRMLKEEEGLLRRSSVRRTLRSSVATFSMYEEKPKLWTMTDQGQKVQCAKLTASSVLDSAFWLRLPQLQKLEVEDGKVLLKALSKRTVDMPKLESLSVVWSEMKALPPWCLKLQLKILTLQQDQLCSLEGIEVLTNLEVLDVSNNALTLLPKSFGSLENLRRLNVCGNKLKQLPDTLGELKKLEMLNCASNRLTALPDSLTSLERLVELDISSNKVERLPENIGNLSKLIDLRATSNHLAELPKSFAKLNCLVSLLLGNNKFIYMPVELGNLERIENLNLRNNHISAIECSLVSVKALILDSNRLTGISIGICRSVNLEILSLEKNLIKAIPEEIVGLKSLRSIQLSGNPLSEIPNSFFYFCRDRNIKFRLLGTKYEKNFANSREAAEGDNQGSNPDHLESDPSSSANLNQSEQPAAAAGASQSSVTGVSSNQPTETGGGAEKTGQTTTVCTVHSDQQNNHMKGIVEETVNQSDATTKI